MDKFKENRMGKFLISKEALVILPADFFSHFTVFRAESVDFGRLFEYVAFSDLFDAVSEGEYCPEYFVSVDTDGNVQVTRSKSQSDFDKLRETTDKLNELTSKYKALKDDYTELYSKTSYAISLLEDAFVLIKIGENTTPIIADSYFRIKNFLIDNGKLIDNR